MADERGLLFNIARPPHATSVWVHIHAEPFSAHIRLTKEEAVELAKRLSTAAWAETEPEHRQF